MKRRCPFRQFHRSPPVYSLRVHWVPVFPSAHRLGAFAISPHPGVPSFPGCRLLCPIRLSSLASSFREAFPPHYFSTALPLHRGVSRVPHGRLQQSDVGGVFISLPLPLFAAPQVVDSGEDRLISVTCPPVSGGHWSVLSPLVYDFGLAWLTSQTRSVRGSVPRRALPRSSSDSPYRSSATHHLLRACLPLMAPFKSMLLTS